MRRVVWVIAGLLLLPALVALAAAAQGQDDGEATTPQGPDAVTVIAMEEQNDSDIMAVAVLRSMDGQTIAVASVIADDDDIGNVAGVAAHEGTCDEPGDQVQELGTTESLELPTMDTDVWTAAGAVDMALEDLASGNFIMAVLSDDGEVLACGDFSIAAELEVEGIRVPQPGGQNGAPTTPTPGLTPISPITPTPTNN